tara:strand:- start:6710 stop:7306 length:597 start_codon:yes stop_codon:yes gene_type:complete
MVLDDKLDYDGELIHNRFAYKYLRKDVNPLGDIVIFRGNMLVEKDGMIDLEDLVSDDFIYSEDAINICWEIPSLNPFGAVAFQRLFNTEIAIMLRKYESTVHMNGDDIMITTPRSGVQNWMSHADSTRKVSVSITYSKDNVALGHTGLNIRAGDRAPSFAFSLELKDAQARDLMFKIESTFYAMIQDMFIATTKITNV